MFAVSMSVQRGDGAMAVDGVGVGEEEHGEEPQEASSGGNGTGGSGHAKKASSGGQTDDGSPSTGEDERGEEGCEMASPRLDLFAAHYDKLGELAHAAPVGASVRLSCSSLFFAKAVKESRELGPLAPGVGSSHARQIGSRTSGAGTNPPSVMNHDKPPAGSQPEVFVRPQPVMAPSMATAVAAMLPGKECNADVAMVRGKEPSVATRPKVDLLDDDDDNEGGAGLNHSLQAERERLKLKERQGRMAQQVAEMRQRLAGLGVVVAHHSINKAMDGQAAPHATGASAGEAARPMSPVAAVSMAAAVAGSLDGLLSPLPVPHKDVPASPVQQGDGRGYVTDGGRTGKGGGGGGDHDDDDDVILRGDEASPGGMQLGSPVLPAGVAICSQSGPGRSVGKDLSGTLLNAGMPWNKAGGVGIMIDDDGEDFTLDMTAASFSGSTRWVLNPESGRARPAGWLSMDGPVVAGSAAIVAAAGMLPGGTMAGDDAASDTIPLATVTEGLPATKPSMKATPAEQGNVGMGPHGAEGVTSDASKEVRPREKEAVAQPRRLPGDDVSVVQGVGGGAWADGDSVLASLSGALRKDPGTMAADGPAKDSRTGVEDGASLAVDTSSEVDSESDVTFDAVTPDQARWGGDEAVGIPAGKVPGVAAVVVDEDKGEAKLPASSPDKKKGLTGCTPGGNVISLTVMADVSRPRWHDYEAVLGQLAAATNDACAMLAELEELADTHPDRKDRGNALNDPSAGTNGHGTTGAEVAVRKKDGGDAATWPVDAHALRVMGLVRGRMAAINGQLAQALRVPAEEPLPEGDLCYEDDSMGGRRLSQMLHGQRLSDIGLGSRGRVDAPSAYEEMLSQYSKQVVAELASLLERQAQQQTLQMEQLLRHHKLL